MINIIAHRGIHNKIIKENTYLSIKNALTSNETIGVEFDIRLTKNKEIVIIHDSNIARTSNSYGIIEDMTYNEIKKYNFGSNKIYQSISLLKDILNIKTNKILIIDIKCTKKNYKEFAYILSLINIDRNIYFVSFNKKILKKLKKYKTKYKLGLICLTNRCIKHNYKVYILRYNLRINKTINKLTNKKKEIFIWSLYKFDKSNLLDNINYIYDI